MSCVCSSNPSHVLGENDVTTQNVSGKTGKTHLASKTVPLLQHNLQFDIDKVNGQRTTTGLDCDRGKRNEIVNSKTFSKF